MPTKITGDSAVDPQTGEAFVLQPEGSAEIAAAAASGIYLLVTMTFLWWLLFDTWSDHLYIFHRLFGDATKRATASKVFHLIAYCAIGGGLGGAVNGLRSLITWHAERRAFGWRFIWRYISLPPLGTTLALMVYAVLRGAVTAVGGTPSVTDGGPMPALAAFASGALAGYGSHRVFIWLDEQVAKLFAIESDGKVDVPSIIGLTKDEAQQKLIAANLVLGSIAAVEERDETKCDKVMSQDPASATKVASGTQVNVTIAAKPATSDGTSDPERDDERTVEAAPGAGVVSRSLQLLSGAQAAVAALDGAASEDAAAVEKRDQAREKLAALGAAVDEVRDSLRAAFVATQAAEARPDTTASGQANASLAVTVDRATARLPALESLAQEIEALRESVAERHAEG